MYVIKNSQGRSWSVHSQEEAINAVLSEVSGQLKGMYRSSDLKYYVSQAVYKATVSPDKEVEETFYGSSFGKGINPGGCLKARIYITYVAENSNEVSKVDGGSGAYC